VISSSTGIHRPETLRIEDEVHTETLIPADNLCPSMARRIEVELTSTKDANTWTWRAAGAREPKGELAASLLYPDAKIGDVVRVEADFHLDGIEILEVFAPKVKKPRSDLLELISRPVGDSELVTEVRARKGRDRDDRGSRRREPKGSERDQREPRRDHKAPRTDRKPRGDAKPRPTRLQPRRVHRDAAIAEIPEEHRPIADQLLHGGLPAVRSAAKGDPNAKQIISIAEKLYPRLQTADWRDRAEAALADIDRLDLRDLRSVVVASDNGARDEETRALAAQLRENLTTRIEADHLAWLRDLETSIKEERTIRALRLTSRPVKAGSPIPVELAERLAAQTAAAMGADTPPDRWASVLDALAFSPIRAGVQPGHFPTDVDEGFLDIVRSVADRVPTIAAHYKVDPSEAKAAAKRVRAARKAAGPRRDGDRRSGRGVRDEGGGGGRDRKPRRDRDGGGPRVDKGPSDLLKTPSRPRPGTIPEPQVEEAEVQPEVEVAAQEQVETNEPNDAAAEAAPTVEVDTKSPESDSSGPDSGTSPEPE
jgi:hypothetical protein